MMKKSIIEALRDLRNNEETALPQLVSLLTEGCKIHELASKQCLNQLKQPEIQIETIKSPMKRKSLPDIFSSRRSKSIQSRHSYINKEIAVLDNVIDDALSEVQIDEDSLNIDDLREGDTIENMEQEENEIRQIVDAPEISDIVRSGQQIIEEFKQQNEIELDASVVNSKQAQKENLKYDKEINITIPQRVLEYQYINLERISTDSVTLEQEYIEKLIKEADTEEMTQSVTNIPQEEDVIMESQVLESSSPVQLELSNPFERTGDFYFNARHTSNKPVEFMNLLIRYQVGDIEIEQLDGDLSIREK